MQFPVGYLKSAFELIRNHGGVCISDEVLTQLSNMCITTLSLKLLLITLFIKEIIRFLNSFFFKI